MTKVSDEAYLQNSEYFKTDFMSLNLEEILHKSIQIYEEQADKMNISASREAWKNFMKKSMAAYIQCLMNSSTKIKQKKSDEAIEKIKHDYSCFEDVFKEYMTSKAMRPSLEVLGDIKNFFEASPDFLMVYIENMRKLHGPSFNTTTVKALLNLRTDMNSKEKAAIFSECKDILSRYSSSDKGTTDGIFNNIDTQGGAAEFLEEMTAKNEADGDAGVDPSYIDQFKDPDEEEFDMDAFLKEGGIDLQDLDEKQIHDAKEQKKKEKLKNRDKIVEIKGDENMKGFLFAEISNIEESSQIFGKIFSTVTDTVNMLANTINKHRTKKYFAIKNKKLFMYKSKNAEFAEDEVVIKDLELLNMDEDNKKGFYFVYKRRCYRMEASKAADAEKWFKSMELVMSKSEEYLNLDRYVDEKVFTKVTGKSLFKDYETILEEHKQRMWQLELQRREKEKQKKMEEEKQKVEEERRKLEEEGKKKAHKIAAKNPLDIAEPELHKTKSQMPTPGKVLEQNTSITKMDTFKENSQTPSSTAPPAMMTAQSSVTKVDVSPVSREAPLAAQPPSKTTPFKMRDIEEGESPKNSKDDRAPLLASGEYSDQEEEYTSKEKKFREMEEKRHESIKNLIKINDERTESMYDIMMQREDSKVSRKNSESKTNKAANETIVSSDLKSTFGERKSTTEKPAPTTRGPPTTTVYEPVHQTSCFGSCMNTVMGIFRRRQ